MGGNGVGVPALGIEMEGEMLSTVKVGLIAVTVFFCSSVGLSLKQN
jgi:hypothetical protein